ncbi:hypothetical protein ACFXAZ_33290 [Streptomyces sp. NPDC059477]|uniref:hypothetical protein n=1 Tax=Streptomyces sp. NPDC059477 TaxID=3346847 RepID=UPI0036B22BAC
MALLVRLASTDDLSEIVEALLTAADAKEPTVPTLAARWRTLARDVGDALDSLPVQPQ